MNLHNINEAVINGEMDALEAFIQLKALSDTALKMMAEMKAQAITEADKYGGKTFEAFGAQIEKRSGGGTWSYKHLPEWTVANEKKKSIEELHKSAYKLQGKEAMVNTETGEIVEAAIYKPNSETIAIKFLTAR